MDNVDSGISIDERDKMFVDDLKLFICVKRKGKRTKHETKEGRVCSFLGTKSMI